MGVDGPPARRFLRFLSFLSLTAFQAEGCGIALSGDEYEVSVMREGFLRWTGLMGRRVRRFDGPSGRGLRYRPYGR